MRATHTPEEILGSRSRIAVLRILWWAKRPLNASQIAQMAKLTRPAVATVLRELSDAEIVIRSSAGQANIHSLNRANVYVQRMIEPIFEAELEIPEEMATDIEESFNGDAVAGVLFGSYARGEQTSHSDVDVVLIAESDTAKAALDSRLSRYAEEFRSRWGAPLSALTYTAQEAGALWRTSPALLESLKDEGVVIFGKGPWEWAEDE